MVRGFVANISGKISFINPVRFFIFTALSFGILFIAITPPFQTPDESVHFYRSYQIAQGNLSVDEIDGKVGGELPSALGAVALLTSTEPTISFQSNKKYNLNKTKQALGIKNDTQQKNTYDFSSTALYPPVAYAPQATGVLISRIADTPPILSMYFARFANLIAWILAFVIAIKIAPKKKWAFAAVGLLPMALFQGGSLSTDVMATGLGAIFIASILYFCNTNKNKFSKRHLFLLLLVAIGMVLTKQVMFILLPLVLLIPNSKIGSIKRAVLTKTSMILLPLTFLGAWLFRVKDLDITSTFANGQVPEEQMKFIIENPHSFINVLWNTSFFSWGDTVTSSLIGTFGWMDAPLGEPLVIVGYIMLFLLFVGSYGKKDKWLTGKQKIIFGLVALAFWGAINAALYVYYSPVEYKIIVGLQGRYFIPLLLLIIPLVYGSWLRMPEHTYRRIAVLMPVVLLVASTITIYFRYYINNV